MNFLTILLQATADSIITSTETLSTPAPQQLSLWYLLKEGGVLMIPLFLCSVVLVYIFVERFLAIRRASQTDINFMNQIRAHMLSGNMNGAKTLATNTHGPIAKIIDKGLSRLGKPIDHIEKSMENTGKLEVYQLEKNLSILSVIAGIAPMFGFLGTIAGMIQLFFNIQHQGFSIENIAGGIYTKMVTSAVGLIIGLVAYVCHNYLNAQINKNVNKMEAAAAEFVDILHEPAAK